MTERKQKYDPFTAKGEIEVKDTPYKGLKRFVTETTKRGINTVDKRKR